MRLSSLFRYTRTAVLTLIFWNSAVLSQAATGDPGRLAQTPPMGWNSWNKFACDINEGLFRDMADAMVSSGMKAAGYEYVNIDDCWAAGRDANGAIVADIERFPSGIKALADYVHSKGLKLGIYTDVGRMTCQKRPGSLDHEAQDIATYASWGVDYVKVDWCFTEGLDPETQYAKFGEAIAHAGRPMVFSICNWGVKAPWRWGRQVGGNLWRTTGDTGDNYDRMSLIGFSQNGLEDYASPGHWNDIDILEVGNGGMTRDQYRTHMALWAILAAPLLAGNDLRTMNDESKSMLMNAEIIAVDQDAKGKAGHRIWQQGWLETWVRPLSDGSMAVGLFNRTEQPIRMSFEFKALGLKRASKIRDLWEHKDVAVQGRGYSADVPGFGVSFVRVYR